MEFGILGPLIVRDHDRREIPLPGPKPRALLAVLLLHANEPVSAARLVEALWGEDAPPESVRTLRVHMSRLRRALGDSDALTTTAAGYRLDVAPGTLDAERFERTVREGSGELEAGRAERAAELLRQALRLWRGPPLADVAHEPFAAVECARLEEQRLTAIELRVEAVLATGRHVGLAGELQRLVTEHPWRERLHGQLMLALYRSGRQADALAAYGRARAALVDALGLEPGPELRELHRAILAQDRSLHMGGQGSTAMSAPPGSEPVVTEPRRTILVLPQGDEDVTALLGLAGRLARTPPGDVVVARMVARPEDLGAAARWLDGHRSALAAAGVQVRAAAFTSPSVGDDLVLLGIEQRVGLALLGAGGPLLETGVADAQLARVLSEMPCDVALLAARAPRDDLRVSAERPVIVPFGGAEHEWAAVQIGAWIAAAYGGRLQLVGTRADPQRGRRDASRLLARAALMVQRVAAVPTEPVLVSRGADEVVAAADGAGLVVLGLPTSWRDTGLGATRLTVLRDAVPPCALVSRGTESPTLAPDATFTRFTWSAVDGT